MLSMGIRYLCGWAMATDVADRQKAEWPPHPDRAFMALVAAHHECDGDAEERVALEWLEKQAPPSLHVALAVSHRTPVTSFVPVNDATGPKVGRKSPAASTAAAALDVLPERRSRQPRGFPVVIPPDPVVHLIWPEAVDVDDHRRALSALCRKVTCIGHSASLVQMWVAEAPLPASLAPDELGETKLRVPSVGRLAQLEANYAAGRRPTTARSQGYAPPATREPGSVAGSVFDDALIILRLVNGPRIGLRSSALFIRSLRGLVMSRAPEPLPEWVSGHREDGRPTDEHHIAFLPLADVGHRHADGHLLGAALAIPRGVPMHEAAALMKALFESGDSFRIYDGPWLNATLQLEGREVPPVALRAGTWCADPRIGSRRWTTATPIVLDRFPKRASDATAAVALACRRVDLPEPVEVACHGVSLLSGAPTAREFPAPTFGSPPARRWHTHATLTFAEPVIGPLVLGAGRYRGYGFCRPIAETQQ